MLSVVERQKAGGGEREGDGALDEERYQGGEKYGEGETSGENLVPEILFWTNLFGGIEKRA